MLLLISPVSGQSTPTVWKVANGDRLSYLQDLSYNFPSLGSKKLTSIPLTFNVTNINNTGYFYTSNFLNSTPKVSVNMQIISVPNFGSFEYPAGGIPIVLPTSFNGKSDWLTSYGNQLSGAANLLKSSNNTSPFLSANVTQDFTSLNLQLNTNITSLTLGGSVNPISDYLKMIPSELLISKLTLLNSTISLLMTYTKQSGILQQFKYTLTSNTAKLENGTQVFYPVKIQQSLTFVTILVNIPLTTKLRTGAFLPWIGVMIITLTSISAFKKFKK